MCESLKWQFGLNFKQIKGYLLSQKYVKRQYPPCPLIHLEKKKTKVNIIRHLEIKKFDKSKL